ncbi:MAG: DNA-3-methyladenine glycosylase 2 family protein [Oscillospiraceae bacterium]|nr:DNA-3-methyladenine glycosylase 2 family protein [Oscillospiraceae bacterium]
MVLISDTNDFSPALMFECGQCFRFTQTGDGVYRGAAFGRVLTVSDTPEGVTLDCSQDDFDNIWKNFFDLGLDYADVRGKITTDEFMEKAVEFGRGIRILRQDFWEALCSFIISQCNNIPRIRGVIERLCAAFGEPIGQGYHAFPAPVTVAELSVQDLRGIGAGYRAEYILNAAMAVRDGALTEEELSGLSFADAKKKLTAMHGIGDKVAHCVLLYGLHRLDAFPEDVWIKRALKEHFPQEFDPAVFGEYAGIAQQYIFHYTRMLGREMNKV